MTRRLAAVICTYNPEPVLLGRVLDALEVQTLPREQWELIIVDNGSRFSVEALPTVVSRSARRVVREERAGLTAARERAAREVQEPLIVFVDDDTVLARDYLAEAVALMNDASIGIASGWCEPEYSAPPPHWLRRFEEGLGVRRPAGGEFRPAGRTYSLDYPIGAGMVLRSHLLRAYFASLTEASRIEGRIGQSLSSGEDLDLDCFALAQGTRIGASSRLRLTHVMRDGRATEAYLRRLHQASLASCLQVNEKWRVSFGHDVFPIFQRPRPVSLLRIVLSAVCSWSPTFRIRLHAERALLALTRPPSARAGSSARHG